MLSKKNLPLILFVAFAVSILAACSEQAEPIAQKTTPMKEAATEIATAGEEPPPGQLSGSVTPIHYKLELRIDPSEDTFSGQVEIEVKYEGYFRTIPSLLLMLLPPEGSNGVM